MVRFNFFFYCLTGLVISWLSVLPVSILAVQTATDTLTTRQIPSLWLTALEAETPFDEETLAHLVYLSEHPLDLNTADLPALLAIPFLEAHKARAILQYRQQHGAFQQVETLLSAGLLHQQAYNRLSPFFRVAEPTKVQEPAIRVTLVQAAGRRIDLDPAFKRPFASGGYQGSALQVYTRLALSSRRIGLRLAFEKDPGEAFLWQLEKQAPGFDHVAGTLTVKVNKLIREIVLGDFHVEAGEGLMLWRNTGQGKGTQPVSDPMRTGKGVRPAASREENRFLRGAAITLQPTPVLVARLFASFRKLDATLVTDRENEAVSVATLGTSGLHRTAGELARKDQLAVSMTGLLLQYKVTALTVGINGYSSWFGNKFTAGQRPADYYDFTGDQLAGASVHFKLQTPALRVFGEWARSFPGTFAASTSMRWTVDERTRFLVSLRLFKPDYYTMHGRAFAEQRSRVQNEYGWYMALETRLHPHLTSSFYADFYKHPWVTATIGMPGHGYTAFARLTYTPRPWFTTSLFYRLESDQQRANGFSLSTPVTGLPIRPSINETAHVLRFQTAYTFSRHIQLRIQMHRRVAKMPTERKTGSMILQDLIWLPNDYWRLQLRFSTYISDGGKATLYAYENDLRYRFTIRAFTGTGSRYFLLLKKRVGTHLTFEVKYSTTHNRQITNPSSSAVNFSGKRIREVQAQFIWHV